MLERHLRDAVALAPSQGADSAVRRMAEHDALWRPIANASAATPLADGGSGGAMFTGSAGGDGGGGAGASPALPPAGPEQGFFRYACSGYVLHHLETPTGYRFVLTSDASAGDLRGALWHLYAELFVGYALKNPLYRVGG